MTVVGAARDANEAVLVAEQATPDVALVDVQMPGGGGARATRELILRSPRTGVVAVSAHGARSVVAEMLRAGAMGFVVKGAPIGEIVDAVRRTARGQGSLSGELTATLGLELDEHLGRRDRANAARREQIEKAGGLREDGDRLTGQGDIGGGANADGARDAARRSDAQTERRHTIDRRHGVVAS